MKLNLKLRLSITQEPTDKCPSTKLNAVARCRYSVSVYCKQKSDSAMQNFSACQFSREGGDIGLFIAQVPKVYDDVFLFVGLTTLGTFIEF